MNLLNYLLPPLDGHDLLRLLNTHTPTTMLPPNGVQEEEDDPMAALMSASSAIAHELPSSAADGNDWMSGSTAQVGFDAAAVAPPANLVVPQQQHVQQYQQQQAEQQQHLQPQTGFCAAYHQHQLSSDAVLCVRCGYAGADVRIKGCSQGCAFHARCIDLLSLSSSGHHGDDDYIRVQVCPSCNTGATGLEIIPLSFVELDRVQRSVSQKVRLMRTNGLTGENNVGGGEESAQEAGKKRSSSELELSELSSLGAMSTSKCYDPSIPRTGRWTDEELAFRDTIIGHFLEGSLPLSNGLKLNDFLSSILKSKQSRLTKKMKHAKLSTKYFRLKDGYMKDVVKAKEFSELEFNFINCVSDPVERSEIQFHMQREWRDHLAERCTYLRIMFDAEKWLQSVDQMDRRVVLEKNRSRMNKRRMLMGKALETDVTDSIPGVFISQDNQTDDNLFADDGDFLKEKLINSDMNDGDFGEFLMSMMEDKGSSNRKKSESQNSDPNFRYAAPFLAAITSYMERNCIPFEHVDLWVPSFVPPSLDTELGSAPQMASMGSGANLASMGQGSDSKDNCRLCFAGSATLNVQVVDFSNPSTSMTSLASLEEKQQEVHQSVSPMSADEIFNFSLYGDYSEKFSFSSGCGLPGRVFKTGIAAWEQFVSNAPSHMFERRGGAVQFGVKTALGLPIESPNVGRIVLVMYSRHNREKDEDLVNRVVKDMRMFNPCPRWKLVVSVSPAAANGENQTLLSSKPPSKLENVSNNNGNGVLTPKENQIRQLISLLGESMPSAADSSSPLLQKIDTIMNLRLTLLRPNRSPEEEQLVDTLLVLFESYLSAGRSKEDTVLLVIRDYDFHTKHSQRVSSMMQQQSSPMLMSMSPPMNTLPAPMLQGGQQGMHSFNHAAVGGVAFFPGIGYQAPPPPPAYLHGHNQMPLMQSFSHQGQGNPQGTPLFGSSQNDGRNHGGGIATSSSNASLNDT